MGFRAFTTCQDDESLLVGEVLGASYDVVRLVQDNIIYIKSVADHLTELSRIHTSIGNIDTLVAQIDDLEVLAEDINQIAPIIANITQLLDLQANMANLMVLHADLPQLNEIYDNLSTFLAEIIAVAGVADQLAAVAANEANINIVAGMQTEILAVPGLTATAQQAAQDAQDAASSNNLPTIQPGDGGKQLFVENDLSGYRLALPAAFPATMNPATYDPNGVAANVFNTDNHVSGAANKVFTLANQQKLANIEIAADVTDKGNVGDAINNAAAKTTLVDADIVTGVDSAAANILARWSWANIKAALKAQLVSLIPQNSKSTAYTLVLLDAGQHIYHPPEDVTPRIWTIPSNASVPYPIGTAITFDNDIGAGALTIAINGDTLIWVGTSLNGTRTLASGGQATIVKVKATRWRISGIGLT